VRERSRNRLKRRLGKGAYVLSQAPFSPIMARTPGASWLLNISLGLSRRGAGGRRRDGARGLDVSKGVPVDSGGGVGCGVLALRLREARMVSEPNARRAFEIARNDDPPRAGVCKQRGRREPCAVRRS
jgi:hypothetical protein